MEGSNLYTSGAQDIAQSLGLPGQPNHQRVKEFEARVHQAVRRWPKRTWAEDIAGVFEGAPFFLARATPDLFLHGATGVPQSTWVGRDKLGLLR